MKKLFFTALLILTTFAMSAQNYVLLENDYRIFDDSETLNMSQYGEFAFTDHVGVTEYIGYNSDYLGNGSYLEALVGLYVRPINNFTVGAMIGVHTDANLKQLRYGAIAYYQTDAVLLSAFYEVNEDWDPNGEWFDLIARYTIPVSNGDNWFVGARWKDGYGVGLPIGYCKPIGSSNVTLNYITYYNEGVENEWLPTVTLQIEF